MENAVSLRQKHATCQPSANSASLFQGCRHRRFGSCPGQSHRTNTSVGGNFWRTFRTIGPYEFPQEKVWTNDWSIWISPGIRMDQWRSKFAESFGLDRYWSIECSSLLSGFVENRRNSDSAFHPQRQGTLLLRPGNRRKWRKWRVSPEHCQMTICQKHRFDDPDSCALKLKVAVSRARVCEPFKGGLLQQGFTDSRACWSALRRGELFTKRTQVISLTDVVHNLFSSLSLAIQKGTLFTGSIWYLSREEKSRLGGQASTVALYNIVYDSQLSPLLVLYCQEWPRQTKPKKGQFMNFPQGHSGTKVQFVNRACFPKKKHQNSQKNGRNSWTFRFGPFFGLVCRGDSWYWSLNLKECPSMVLRMVPRFVTSPPSTEPKTRKKPGTSIFGV